VTAEQTRFFDDKMVESETRLKEAKQALLTFQRANRLFTTEPESALILANISALETLMSKQKSALDSASTSLSPNAPQLQQLRSDISALENQIRTEKDA
jgi:capsule polysaccharide export protein KpsE/RkpR